MNHQEIFYYHLIDTQKLHDFLRELDLDESLQSELIETVYKTIYIEVTHHILTNLPQEHHYEILQHLENKPHDKGILTYLKRSISDFEENLTNIIDQIVNDFIHEASEYKNTTTDWLKAEIRHKPQ